MIGYLALRLASRDLGAGICALRFQCRLHGPTTHPILLTAPAWVQTLNAFQTEWYELQHAGRVDGIDAVPDVYQHNQDLEDQVGNRWRSVAMTWVVVVGACAARHSLASSNHPPA